MVVDLLDTPELVVLSFDDEPMEEESQEDSKDDPKLGEPKVDHGVKDLKWVVSDSSFNSGEEYEDEFNLDYDPSWDHQIGSRPNFLVSFHFLAPTYTIQPVGQLHLCRLQHCIRFDKSFQLG